MQFFEKCNKDSGLKRVPVIELERELQEKFEADLGSASLPNEVSSKYDLSKIDSKIFYVIRSFLGKELLSNTDNTFSIDVFTNKLRKTTQFKISLIEKAKNNGQIESLEIFNDNDSLVSIKFNFKNPWFNLANTFKGTSPFIKASISDISDVRDALENAFAVFHFNQLSKPESRNILKSAVLMFLITNLSFEVESIENAKLNSGTLSGIRLNCTIRNCRINNSILELGKIGEIINCSGKGNRIKTKNPSKIPTSGLNTRNFVGH